VRDRSGGEIGAPHAAVDLEVVGEITAIETIAVGAAIRTIARLRKKYGSGRWRKRKGIATVRLANGVMCRAEVHWYEAHGIGKKALKIKRFLR
jgi:hypothetical protein